MKKKLALKSIEISFTGDIIRLTKKASVARPVPFLLFKIYFNKEANMEFSVFYCKLSRGLGLRTSQGITDRSCVIRTFTADSFESAVLNCTEIQEDVKRYKRIPVILVEYLEEPTYTTVVNELAEYQRIVEGTIDIVECVDLRGLDIICNDDGKILKLPLNRALTSEHNCYDIIAGNMIITETNDNGDTVGISLENAVKAHSHFIDPEIFILNDSDNSVEVMTCSHEMGRIMKLNFIPNISLK